MEEFIRKTRLVKDHNIKFKGPVRPSAWPAKQKHIFQVIRDISTHRFDEYLDEDGTELRNTLEKKHRERVKDLIKSARKLRKEPNSNESTWRHHIEPLVTARFKEDVVCPHCRHERLTSEHEAQPIDDIEKEKLQRKRRGRRPCKCNLRGTSIRDFDGESDEEDDAKKFHTLAEARITHDPDDNLEASRISMIPDIIIGLSKTKKYEEYIASFPVEITHCPVRAVEDLIYPFLIIEAKREKNSPGFRHIETQTAFPIRRFLKIQDTLRKTSHINLDPLVWFFAFQGEVWRLYAATIDENKVRVFDLWLGSIESEDGALQILQIVDYIWSWARDIYRPQIRRCLRRHEPNLRAASPSSTVPFDRSQSVFSISSVRSFPQPFQDSVRDDVTMTDTHEASQAFNLRDASSHPFLKWADRDLSRSWTIRHSNLVAFSFRVLEIPSDSETFLSFMTSLHSDSDKATMNSLLLLDLVFGSKDTFFLTRYQIWQMEKFWTEGNVPIFGYGSMTKPDQTYEAFLFFRTFCQPENWQIKREVYCIIWSPDSKRLVGNIIELPPNLSLGENSLQSAKYSDFIRAFRQLQNLSNKESVIYAFRKISLVLTPCQNLVEGRKPVEWRLPQDGWISEAIIAQLLAIFDAFFGNENVPEVLYFGSSRTLQVLRTEPAVDAVAGLPHISDSTGREGAIIAMKPDSFQPRCPRFCLFVLVNHEFTDKAELGRLLESTLRAEKMSVGSRDAGQGQPTLTQQDKRILRNWVKSMLEG